MSKVILNSHEYDGIEPQFLDSITSRVSNSLLRQKANRITIDQMAVTAELDRLFGTGIKLKSWYKDFVVQYCRDRKIPCDVRNL